MASGFRSILPYRLGFLLGAGTIVPVAPVSTSASPQSIISGLDIRREITEIRLGKVNKPADQNLAKLLTSIQDYANTIDQRIRQFNTIGTKDAAGNVKISAATFTIQQALQVFFLSNGGMTYGLPAAAPSDSAIPNSAVAAWVNEGSDELTFRVRYSDGTLKTGVVPLT